MVRHIRLIELLAVACIVVLGAPVLLSGQGGAAKYQPPRMADGHPDLQGTYTFWDDTPFETAGVPTRRRDGDEGAVGSADVTVRNLQAQRRAAGLPEQENVFYAESPVVPKRASIVVEPAN